MILLVLVLVLVLVLRHSIENRFNLTSVLTPLHQRGTEIFERNFPKISVPFDF